MLGPAVAAARFKILAIGRCTGRAMAVEVDPAAANEELRRWSPQDNQEEAEALGKIVLAFRDYPRAAEAEIQRWERNFHQLPERHQRLLSAQQQLKFRAARRGLQANALFLSSLLASFDQEDEAPPHLAGANRIGDMVERTGHQSSYDDYDKVKYVLKNLARDWSAEGAEERECCYGPILAELQNLFGNWPSSSTPPRVLVPGCGLARLCCEVAGLGLEAQGNEFSYHMLLASAFMLNQVEEAGQFSIHPWMHSNCNQSSDQEQMRAVGLPDIAPADIVAGPGLLSMCAGDFVEVYSREDSRSQFECVVTCFFMDTAHNVLEYMEVIWHCLRPGGYWINLGPLLYHWAESTKTEELSVELSLQQLMEVAQQLGFHKLREQTVVAPYIANIRSMYKTTYDAAMWTMVKTAPPYPLTQTQAPPPPSPPLMPQQQPAHGV